MTILSIIKTIAIVIQVIALISIIISSSYTENTYKKNTTRFKKHNESLDNINQNIEGALENDF